MTPLERHLLKEVAFLQAQLHPRISAPDEARMPADELSVDPSLAQLQLTDFADDLEAQARRLDQALHTVALQGEAEDVAHTLRSMAASLLLEAGLPGPTQQRPTLEAARLLVEHTERLVEARNGGADLYPFNASIDALEHALALLRGEADKRCSICHAGWAPNHRHVARHTWVEAS